MHESSFFDDLKVVELASVLAGPSVGMFFAELGATVTKVENAARGGDVTRNWRVPGETSEGPSAYFSSINFKKQYLSIDALSTEGKEKLASVLADADIVISNYQERVASKLALTYERIQEINPEVIFLQLDGFTNSSRPAFDVVLQAETGWISMTGVDDSPAKLPVALIDVLAGHQLKEAALLALLKKSKTGKGSLVKCDLEKSSLSALANQATNYLMNGNVAQPIGTMHPNIAPYGDWYKCADGVVFVLAVGSDKQFENLLELIGLQEHKVDFATNTLRLNKRAELNALIQAAAGTRESEELFKKFTELGIPYGEVKRLDKVLNSQAARELVKTENIEGRDTSRLSSVAFSTSFLDET